MQAAGLGLETPPLAGTPSIDASYQALVAALPGHLRAPARELPYKLGLTRAADGGWEEFVGLHPNRELPVYAAEACPDLAGGGRAPAGGGRAPAGGDRAPGAGALHRFVSAHHAGGFAWLLRDRLADNQVAADDSLLELSRLYVAHWRAALEAATREVAMREGTTSEGTMVDALTGDAISRWRYATALERRVRAAEKLRPGSYALLVRDKLGWIGVPARALLLVGGAASREPAFRRAHDLFLLALQAIDDVIDRDEDRRLRGADVPTALGCSPGALLRVAPKLAGRAAEVAREAGFGWFGSWLDTFALAIRCWRLDGDAVDDELGAIGIAGEIEEACAAKVESIAVPASLAPAPPRA
jgi:hypothetical protein